jgi:hypothetical protein
MREQRKRTGWDIALPVVRAGCRVMLDRAKVRAMMTLILLTLIVTLLAFPIRSPWREAIAIVCVVLVALLWLSWTGAITIHGRWV